MGLPSFTGEASLYKTGQFYRGYSGAAGGDAARGVVLSAVCGTDCFALCGLVAGGATAGCIVSLLAALAAPPPVDLVLAGVAFGVCEALGVGVSAIACALNCPSCPDGGGGGAPPECCPFGRTCRCGGKCVNVNGQLRCVDGVCLGPNQRCP